MDRIALLVNEASGSFAESLVEELEAAFREGGCALSRVFRFPDDDMPAAEMLAAQDITTLAVCAGDGTINHAVRNLADWPGRLLVLAGGTMNLLCKRLHGLDDNAAIIRRFCRGEYSAGPIDVVHMAECDALVGVIAGPTAVWNEVREAMRAVDLGSLAEAVPHALDKTFNGDPVRLANSTETYPALFVTTEAGQLRLSGFRADSVGALFAHGMAWIGGDFREGPHDELGHCRETVIVHADEEDRSLALLVDGEPVETAAPCRLELAQSRIGFIRTHL